MAKVTSKSTLGHTEGIERQAAKQICTKKSGVINIVKPLIIPDVRVFRPLCQWIIVARQAQDTRLKHDKIGREHSRKTGKGGTRI